ncbi:MAG: hypothetical protein AB8B56_03145 [Crocinitomicaceae bacterium]
MVGSLEVGFNLFKPKRRFNLGVGLGTDFYTLVKTVHDNGMIITTDVITTISTPGNASSTTNTTTAEHDYQSEEWNEHVLNAQWSPFVPKLTLTVSYRIAGRVTIFGKGQVRFLLQNGDHVSERSILQYPISGGIQYNFK